MPGMLDITQLNNLAVRFSPRIVRDTAPELFSNAVDWNMNWEFIPGSMTIKLYDLIGVVPTEYGVDRKNPYGDMQFMDNEVQELTMRTHVTSSVPISIPSTDQTQLITNAVNVMTTQQRDVINPGLDLQRFTNIGAGAKTKITTGTVDETNIFKAIVDARTALSNKGCPTSNRKLFVNPDVAGMLILDKVNFLGVSSDEAVRMRMEGYVGKVAGFTVVEVPADRLPAGCRFIAMGGKPAMGPQLINDVIPVAPGVLARNIVLRMHNAFDTFVIDALSKYIYYSGTSAPVALRNPFPTLFPSGSLPREQIPEEVQG